MTFSQARRVSSAGRAAAPDRPETDTNSGSVAASEGSSSYTSKVSQAIVSVAAGSTASGPHVETLARKNHAGEQPLDPVYPRCREGTIADAEDRPGGLGRVVDEADLARRCAE